LYVSYRYGSVGDRILIVVYIDIHMTTLQPSYRSTCASQHTG